MVVYFSRPPNWLVAASLGRLRPRRAVWVAVSSGVPPPSPRMARLLLRRGEALAGGWGGCPLIVVSPTPGRAERLSRIFCSCC